MVRLICILRAKRLILNYVAHKGFASASGVGNELILSQMRSDRYQSSLLHTGVVDQSAMRCQPGPGDARTERAFLLSMV